MKCFGSSDHLVLEPTGIYHSRQNNYRCTSVINSKTISVIKKITEIFFAELVNSKNNFVRMKLQTLQKMQILPSAGSWSVLRRRTHPSTHFFVSKSRSVVDCAHIQAFTFLLTKTLSRSRSVVDCAHIRAFTFSSQDHGRLPDEYISKHSPFSWCWNSQDHGLTSTYPSIRNKNVHTCWTPWSPQETRGLWARPPVLSPVPTQAIHSRACLNLHLCDIQSTAQKSPCVNTFLRPSSKRKRNLLDTVWEPGKDTQNKDNGHVRQQRDTTHGTTDT